MFNLEALRELVELTAHLPGETEVVSYSVYDFQDEYDKRMMPVSDIAEVEFKYGDDYNPVLVVLYEDETKATLSDKKKRKKR